MAVYVQDDLMAGGRVVGSMKIYLTENQYSRVMDCLDNMKDAVTSYINKWEKLLGSGNDAFDSRVAKYYIKNGSMYSIKYTNERKLLDIKEEMKAIERFQDYITGKQREMIDLDRRLAGKGGEGRGPRNTASQTTAAPTIPVGIGELVIPASAFDDLSGQDKQDLVAYLRSLGFTDEEINNLKEGKFHVNKMTLQQLSTEFASLKNKYPDFYNKLVEIVGFDIYNEDGTVNQERLAMLMAIAGKVTGLNVNLEKGSAFRTLLDDYKDRLEAAYKNDPSIRQLFIDKYGMDIFNDDGTVDLERLALVKMMDGLKPGEYNLDSLIPAAAQATVPLSVEPTAPATIPISGPVNPPGPEPTNSPTNPPTNPSTSPSTKPHGSDIIENEPTTPSTYSTTTQNYGLVGEDRTKPLASATASAKDGLSIVGNKILGAIGAGTKGISKKIINSGAVKLATSKIATNKASVGIIAAAGLGAGGALTGGGIALSKKLHYIKFTPDNWLALPEETQATIEQLMKEVGFDEEELETFKNSCFKIRADELKNHTKKIEQTSKNSTDSEEELIGQYKYSIINETGKADNYLTFITMIIDGKNSADQYNMYNILNQHLEGSDDSDFVYMGINMEDYIDEEDDIDSIIEIDDPSIQKLDDDVIEDTSDDLASSLSLDESEDSISNDFMLDDDSIDESEAGFDSNIEESEPEEKPVEDDTKDEDTNDEKLDFASLANSNTIDSEEAGFGQDSIGGSFELADDTKDRPQSMSEHISEKEWLKSIGIDD